ncbi:hypothetical protein TWF569_008951 [Orbilia oligospora]|uniref:Wax synthase domain-containing protein n=1 Tax=Orbilia oligospora TaxID=2813651 RepID=A0A7C8J3W1_ORBOL|nr:hypothetical protein TWF102_010569 [Orbilia oligospora]KAF3097923.1 hypothetical protein TWF706_006872 [Orbilia oligospora]KAF3105825.1 hypothetical protein TWF103_006524 [Orbilia oligospora]KAF3145383.1 hypothetical protein TWF594_004326 [Orbilia oligospora]KAF3155582.1 hypothetical protein TWF569_008951 [Orbilia oligospora]
MAPPGGTTLINYNFCTRSVFLFVPTYFLTLLVTSTLLISTPKGSLTRYASLPIIAYLCLRIFNYGAATFPHNVVGLIDWAGSAYNVFLISSTLLQLEGIDSTDPVISRPVNGRPPGYFTRLWRGLSYCVNVRGINTPYQIKNVPAFDSKRPGWVPSRRRFLATSTAWFLVLYLAQDFFYSQEITKEDEVKFLGINRENLFWRHPQDGSITGDEMGYRIAVTSLMWSILIPLSVNLQYTFLSILAVGTGVSEPKNWPPPFGSPKDSYTLRLFWGKFWHQTLRWHFSKPAQFITHKIFQLPKTGLIQRYVNTYGVFLISGIWHAGQSWLMLHSQGPEIQQAGWNRELFFFTVMATGIMIEDGVQWLFRSQKVRNGEEKEGLVVWKRAIGYIWVWGLLVLVAPFIDYPKFRARSATFLPAHPLIILDPEWKN